MAMDKKDTIGFIRKFVALVGVGIAIAFTLWYTAHQDAQNDRRWCKLMVSLDQRYQALPSPVTPEAAQFRDNVHELTKDLGCKGRQ